MIGAGTVMVKDAEPWGVYAGNPAKYIKKNIKEMNIVKNNYMGG